MGNVTFEDFTVEIKGRLEDLSPAILEEVGGELDSAVKRNNTRVRSGKTKNSWRHEITQREEDFHVTIGSPEQNAIWEEFGTGDYALNGDGRKGGWAYVDEEGELVFTHGKRPIRPLWNAFNELRDKLIQRIQDAFREELS